MEGTVRRFYVSPNRKALFTVDEYYRMAEAGILSEDDHVELLEGEVVEMSPIAADMRRVSDG